MINLSEIQITGKFTTATIMLEEHQLESETRSQIYSFVSNKAFTGPIAIMPDTHPGAGCVIGFTMPIGENIIPNIVGVDIDCGMLFLRTRDWHSGLGTDTRNPNIDELVRASIPFGMNVHEKAAVSLSDFDWKTLNTQSRLFTLKFNKRFGTSLAPAHFSDSWFTAACKRLKCDESRILRSLGTLGGGNHFIEFGRSAEGDIGITIHTGSRSLGKAICEYWQTIAAIEQYSMSKTAWIEKVKTEHPQDNWNKLIKAYKHHNRISSGQPRGLEYLSGAEMHSYLSDMMFAQAYARLNRKTIAYQLQKVIEFEVIEQIETEHNFISFDDWIIRKGAVASYKGTKLVIPLNMTDGVLICEGKSNSTWNFSAPHGAGRIGSRSMMKKKLEDGEITKEDLTKSMAGIYAAGIPVDECKAAYKSSAMILTSIEPTATVLECFKPFLAMKDLVIEDKLNID